MRITNKIIQNNAIGNINGNKVLEDQLNTQLSTGKKVNRPSDDPVVAIRALRLRTNLSQVNQYYKNNVPDAKSWLTITEDAINTATSVINDMYSDCTTGSEGFKTADDRQKILDNLKGLRDEMYAIGNADYAGRYVFTGYRTDTSLTFGKDTTQKYTVTEQLTASDIGSMTYVSTDNLENLTEAGAAGLTTTENDISNNTLYRIRLAYDDCDAGTAPSIQYYDADGNQQTVTATVISANDSTQDAYMALQGDASDAAVFIPETGELILSDSLRDKLQGVKDLPGTTDAAGNDINEAEIRITYDKSEWGKNDLRPEHYFYCETTTAGGTLKYNEGYLNGQTDDDSKQIISYDVGFGQSIRVNTMASEVFTPDIGRDIGEMITAVEDVVNMETAISKLENLVKNATDDTTKASLQEKLDAANKAKTYLEGKMQKCFESGITKSQGYLSQTNTALTSVGNRAARVDLVENRLSSQQTSFKTLSSENEDADLTEVAVELSSVELSYQAALMATGKITQTTLLNYL